MLKFCISVLLLATLLAGGYAVALVKNGNAEADSDVKDVTDSSDCAGTQPLISAPNSLLDVNTLLCRVARLIRSVLRQLSATKRPIVIMRGLEIVPSMEQAPPSNSDAAATPSDTSVLGRFSDYLRTHDLNIKFSDLLTEESERLAARDADQNGVNVEEGRQKKDKGHGSMLMVSMMFSKLMAVMTLGGISAVAMKALGLSMAALLMSSMHGLKAMNGHHKDEGHQGRRRRRNVAVTWPSAGTNTLHVPPASPVFDDWKRKTSVKSW